MPSPPCTGSYRLGLAYVITLPKPSVNAPGVAQLPDAPAIRGRPVAGSTLRSYATAAGGNRKLTPWAAPPGFADTSRFPRSGAGRAGSSPAPPVARVFWNG